jgi:hypothetical protein
MANQDPSIADVIKEALRDAQDLIRGELALAKAELREEASRLGRGAALLAAAAFAGALAVVFLLTSIAWGISAGLDWPVWAGFAIVTLLMLITAGVLGALGRKRLTADRHMPRTVDTMKENAKWMRARTS